MAITKNTSEEDLRKQQDEEYLYRQHALATKFANERVEQLKIGENLRNLRKRFRYTQPEIAEIMGVSLASYCEYEAGRRDPSIASLARLVSYENHCADETGHRKIISLDEIVLNEPERNHEKIASNALQKRQEIYRHIWQFHFPSIKSKELQNAFITFVDLNALAKIQSEFDEDHIGHIERKYFEFFRAGPDCDPNWDIFMPEEYADNPEECEKEQKKYANRVHASWVYEVKNKGLDPDKILRLLADE